MSAPVFPDIPETPIIVSLLPIERLDIALLELEWRLAGRNGAELGGLSLSSMDLGSDANGAVRVGADDDSPAV